MVRERMGEKEVAGVNAPARGWVEWMLCRLTYAVLGLLLGSAALFFGVYPFGLAFAGAAEAYLPAVALGVLLSALLMRRYALALAVLALVAVRVVVSFLTRGGRRMAEAVFAERVSYRITAVAAVALVQGCACAVMAGFRFYELFGTLLAVAAAPLATFLYLGFFGPRDKLFRGSYEVGVGAVVMTGVFALRTVSLFGIYPAAVAAAGVALVLASHRGIFVGMAGGLLAGVCFDFALAPAFLLMAVGFSLLGKSSRGGGVTAGVSFATAYAYLVYGQEGILRLLPALLVTGALFLAFDSAGLVEGAPARHLLQARRRAAEQLADTARAAYGRGRLQELSGAFLDLSATFYELSTHTRRPSLGELRRLCDKAFER